MSLARSMSSSDVTVKRLVGGNVIFERTHPSGKTHFRVVFTPAEWSAVVVAVSVLGDVDPGGEKKKRVLGFHMGDYP